MPDFSGSQTGHISAVSLPTYYVSMVLVDGVVHKVDGNGGLISADDPDTVIKNPDGTPFTIDQARSSGASVSSTFSDVSWRTPFGAEIQHPQDAVSLIEALNVSAPEVNTIRLDLNFASLGSARAMSRFKAISEAAADAGMGIIVQYSDGEMAGRETPDSSLYPGKASDPSARMAEIGGEWRELMGWFEQPENAKILGAVYGWEVINEPMAYKNNATAGAAYAQDVISVLNDHGTDWHGKKILVGGLNASAQFENIDVDAIRGAVGDDLIWSMHLYPDWGNPGSPTFTDTHFLAQMEKRIGKIAGDDILLTETHMGNADSNSNGVPDLYDLDSSSGGAAAFNAARAYEFFAENGIGMTYWPPVGRASAFLVNAGKGQWSVLLPQLAASSNIWSAADEPDDRGADEDVEAEMIGPRFNTRFAQAYGYGGDDTLRGIAGETNLLYGGSGDDLLIGGDAQDYLFGQDGDDDIFGDGGDDRIHGGAGSNLMDGGRGNDWIEGTGERDTIIGGEGDDTLIASGGAVVSGGEGADVLALSGTGAGAVLLTDFGDGDVIDLRFWPGQATRSGSLNIERVLVEGGDGRSSAIRITSSSDEALDLVIGGAIDAFDPAESIRGLAADLTVSGPGDAEPVLVYDARSGEWGPVEEPGPEDPPVEPAPVDPEPVEPVDPAPVDPADPDPVDPADPEPTDPDIPDPDEPETPGGPDPIDPADPGPVDPEPTVPEPADPTPEPQPDEDEEIEQDPETGSGGGCFVVTAAYGDRAHPDVVAMRRFRDERLVRWAAGRAVIRGYWRVGPVLARRVNPQSVAGRALRAAVSSFVRRFAR